MIDGYILPHTDNGQMNKYITDNDLLNLSFVNTEIYVIIDCFIILRFQLVPMSEK